MEELKNVPFSFKNEVIDGATVITLSGVVGKPYPWEDEDSTINEKLISNALSEVDGDILIRLNSQGGDVFEGISICNYLKSLDNKVTVEVTALAASAASIIAMGADKVIMDEGSSMMIHEASTLAWGNKQDIKKVLGALETIDESLVAIYQAKTGLSDETLNDLITNETWFTAEEALSQGFADEIKVTKQEEPEEEKDDVEDKLQVIFNRLETLEAVASATVEPKETKKPTILQNLLGGI